MICNNKSNNIYLTGFLKKNNRKNATAINCLNVSFTTSAITAGFHNDKRSRFNDCVFNVLWTLEVKVLLFLLELESGN